MRSLLLALLLLPTLARALDDGQVLGILKEVDTQRRNNGDFKARIFMEAHEKDKNDQVFDAVVYRRDADDKLMILFLDPKTERGKGYLRLDKNMWYYDPRVGKWERRTERERIGGTDGNRRDFDESRLADEYAGKWVQDGKLGIFATHELELTAKPGIDVAFPKIKLWIDQAAHTVLKEQRFAASGKLQQTVLYPKWKKIYSESKGADVWFPYEIRIFDEIEKANRTIIVMREVDLKPLESNLFTKAWLESKSR